VCKIPTALILQYFTLKLVLSTPVITALIHGMGWVLEGWVGEKGGVGLEGKGEKKKKDEMKEKMEKVVASKQDEHDRLRSLEGCPVGQPTCIY
jgi:hypothetical protein